MDDEVYRKKLLTYSVLVVLAAVFSSSTPLLVFVDLPGAWTVTLGIAAIVLFIYATAWFGSYLRLTGAQWAIAVLLALLAWVGSVIYLVTRKPNAVEA